MTPLRVLLSALLDWVLRRRRDRRLDDEIRTHLELLTEQYVPQGMPAADAGSPPVARLAVSTKSGRHIVNSAGCR